MSESSIKPKQGKRRGPIPSGRSERESQRRLMAAKRRGERDIEIPPVVNPARKAACEQSLLQFAETYFSQPPNLDKYPNKLGLFCLEPSEMHKVILSEFQDRILFGGMKAVAAFRGGGKDTLAIIAGLWATFYGHSRCFIFACWEAGQAADRIATLKEQVEINDLLFEDFPEVCFPARALERAAQRAKQQTVGGDFTRIEWGQHVVLPTVEGSKASGCIIAPASIGASIRGKNFGGVRPDFVAISDPQTRDAAKSQVQQEDILDIIRSDFGGLGAHSESLACLALVTIIKRGDVADQLTDPDQFPQWGGTRYPALIEWPVNMNLWERYDELMGLCAKAGDTSAREAHRYYLENREAMDAGADVTWQAAFIDKPAADGSRLEVSALQHFMNLRYKWGDESFQTEFQHEPPEADRFSSITADLVASRLSLYPPGVAPLNQSHKLVQFIDVGGRELHYAVLSCGEDGSSCFIDYGQLRTDAPEGDLRDQTPSVKTALELRILASLRAWREETQTNPYRDSEGNALEMNLSLIDSGWLTNVVYSFCRESGPRWLPSKGAQARQGSTKYSSPQNPGGNIVRIGDNWHGVRQANGMVLWFVNVDYWKLYAHERFLQTPWTPGSVTLFGHAPEAHKRFAAHIVSEEFDVMANRWIQKSKWNHYLDCAVGCFAAANMIGIRLGKSETPERIVSEYVERNKGEVKKGGWKIGR